MYEVVFPTGVGAACGSSAVSEALCHLQETGLPGVRVHSERVMDGGSEAAGARTHQIMRDVLHQGVGLYLKALRTH